MNESAISVRYAKALYQVSEESDKLDEVQKNILTLEETIKESPEFIITLQSPVIKTSEKINAFSSIFSKEFNSIVINFFTLLAQNKRELYLKAICMNFLDLYRERQGIKEAVLTTASEISTEYYEEILAFLKKKFKLNIELKSQVNPDIIGGFRLRIGDEQIDASISSKLRKIQSELINA